RVNGISVFFFQAEDGIQDRNVTGVQTCALPISGAAGTFHVSFTGVSHTNVTPVGTLHHTATVTGAIAFTPDDPTQPTYTGEFTRSEERRVGKECRPRRPPTP